MSIVTTLSVPYLPDSADYFRKIRHLPMPVWLDSGHQQGHFGRFDILSAAPTQWIKSLESHSEIHDRGEIQLSQENPFGLLRQLMASNPISAHQDLPFCGGIIGYWSYNLKRAAEPSLTSKPREIAVPDMVCGYYPWALIQDHQSKQSYIVAAENESSTIREIADCLQNETPAIRPFSTSDWSATCTKKEYVAAFSKIIDYIHAGDCYQVNLAQQFITPYHGDPLTAYLSLRQTLPSPYSGYFDFGDDGCLLTFSPERFLELQRRQVETRPIKGTIARGVTPAKDQLNARTLQNSEKDRAENLMIVDLLRNDIGKVCEPGSVAVPELFALESYANVHHLVSKVTGRLKSGENAADLLQACFPGGSITGAPKIRSMQIIDELEPVERSAYCGSFGYISNNGRMDTNILIRSLVCDKASMYCWGGGGIVADSVAGAEYDESITKVKVLLDALQQFNRD